MGIHEDFFGYFVYKREATNNPDSRLFRDVTIGVGEYPLSHSGGRERRATWCWLGWLDLAQLSKLPDQSNRKLTPGVWLTRN
jgi:hypothetical protein